MGYRDTWLTWRGRCSRHSEMALHAYDAEIKPTEPVTLLQVGVENGGDLEVWSACLPEGSTVLGMDVEAVCASFGQQVVVVDATDKQALRNALRGLTFDYIINDTRTHVLPHLWPYLKSNGKYFVEGYRAEIAAALLGAFHDQPTWLPEEEILSVTAYAHVLVVQKRQPKVVPFLEICTGEVADVVSLDRMTAAGIKKIVRADES